MCGPPMCGSPMCETPAMRVFGTPNDFSMFKTEDKLKVETMPETLALMLAQAMKNNRELRGELEGEKKYLETIRGELKAAKESSSNYYDIWKKGANRIEALGVEVAELKLELRTLKREKRSAKKKACEEVNKEGG